MVKLEGRGLHSGERVAVVLSASPGPTRFAQRGRATALADLGVARTDRGVSLRSRDRSLYVDLVEHLLAALGGLGIRGGVRLDVDAEIPLLDGGSERFVEALRSLDLPSAPPTLRVLREAEITHESSVYRFSPGDEVSLVSDICFPAPIGDQRASWGGDPDDFARAIAPARTFGFLREREALLAQGRARHVDPESVLVFDDERSLSPTRWDDEPARHKLLDLIGDLTLYGGPPRGRLHAHRPGHTATHAVVARALAAGVLA